MDGIGREGQGGTLSFNFSKNLGKAGLSKLVLYNKK